MLALMWFKGQFSVTVHDVPVGCGFFSPQGSLSPG